MSGRGCFPLSFSRKKAQKAYERAPESIQPRNMKDRGIQGGISPDSPRSPGLPFLQRTTRSLHLLTSGTDLGSSAGRRWVLCASQRLLAPACSSLALLRFCEAARLLPQPSLLSAFCIPWFPEGPRSLCAARARSLVPSFLLLTLPRPSFLSPLTRVHLETLLNTVQLVVIG